MREFAKYDISTITTLPFVQRRKSRYAESSRQGLRCRLPSNRDRSSALAQPRVSVPQTLERLEYCFRPRDLSGQEIDLLAEFPARALRTMSKIGHSSLSRGQDVKNHGQKRRLNFVGNYQSCVKDCLQAG